LTSSPFSHRGFHEGSERPLEQQMKCIRFIMLTVKDDAGQGSLVVMIHWLGGSAQSWNEVTQQLTASGFHCLSIDLPGFGESRESSGFSVTAMVQSLVETIRSIRLERDHTPWLLAGHSMGGKLATILSRVAEDGEDGLGDLRGLVLLSPSPPCPEPMNESKREKTVHALGWETRDPRKRRLNAEKFVDENTGKLPLLDEVRERTVDDVLRMNPDALTAWMRTGSKEDWSREVGTLAVPTLIMSGTEEKALGPATQEADTIGHFTTVESVPLQGGGHLAPLERPWEVADRMMEFFDGLGCKRAPRKLGPGFAALIASDRTSPQTRKVMFERMENSPVDSAVLEREELRTLRALAACVVPEAGFDVAERLHGKLGHRTGDGWRFNSLPEDGKAWKKGLASLDALSRRKFGVPFVALDRPRQNEMLTHAQGGALHKDILGSLDLCETAETLDAPQMRDWFEDVRGELVKLYVADPRTMERMGFTGFADEMGFTKIQLGEQNEVEI
jgi:pimeloyl-ACP methyl ester carboxylesterase